ncbi:MULTISPECIES: hypothetical protein [unclassified Streptomyces]|uniref:hypothetical protein n=1 Tax=unclassified Streptomyces TaxID=2593676 RepID=UPI000DC2E565|nr:MULTISPECIES: hypothetical protein [unclassified Streptomyces]MYT71187.1 hypothetical protein [Streptomyces sp. SID8367]RAJ69596.1 hypothetical protein K377_07990 [Streptomyces sp. PsTaAH-137]
MESNTHAARPRWQIKGITDECTTCECCGRSNLRRTVALCPLDAEGNEGGGVSYYGTACAADTLRWTTTKVTNTARLATRQCDERDAWARRIISVFAPVEHATAREQANARFSRNPHSKGPASAEVAGLLEMARAQLTDITLAPARPHTVADFQPYWAVWDGTQVLRTVAVLPDRTAARRSVDEVIRQSRARRVLEPQVHTVHALDMQAAEEVAYAHAARARYESYRSQQGWRVNTPDQSRS